MTKKDFDNYIKSFHKKKGNYTDDEILAICVEHKNLPRVERDWNKLAVRLGVHKSGETLRVWTKNKQLANGTLVKNENLLSSRTVEDLGFDEFSELVEEKKRSLAKQTQKFRDERSAYNRIIRNDARSEELIETIERLGKNVEVPSIKYDGKIKSNPTEAVLLFSDLHIGAESNNFYNKYNTNIAVARVNKLVEDTIKYCKANNVETLNVLNLGDLIHGTIHISAKIEQTEDVVSQVITASKIVANMLIQLQKAAPNVVYRSCSDNHSRLTPNKDEAIPSENLGRVIDFYLSSALKGTNIVMANDNLDYGLGKFTLKNGKICMFAHGHEDKQRKVAESYICATREFIDYIFLGHYHSFKVNTNYNIKVITNGSIVGTEQYALSKRLFGTAEQTLLIFDKDNTITTNINLQEIQNG